MNKRVFWIMGALVGAYLLYEQFSQGQAAGSGNGSDATDASGNSQEGQ